MKSMAKPLWAAALRFTALGAGAQPWSIIDLGPSHHISNMALNGQAWIVWGSKLLVPGPTAYTATELFSADGSNNNLRPFDINSANVVVGRDDVNGSWQAFAWQGGLRTNLPSLPNYTGTPQAWARGINDSGPVVGDAGDDAAIWSPDGAGGQGITTLGWYWEGSKIGSGAGVAINGAGAGLMATVHNTYRPGCTTGLGSPITILGEGLIEWPLGVALNDSHAVVGNSSYNCGGYSCTQPFVWQGATVSKLPAVPEGANWPSTGMAWALNESGAVVGELYYGSYDLRAVLWQPVSGGWAQVDMNTLLPAGSPFVKLTQALDINESGQVIGLGSVSGDWQVHAFLMTPVPEAPTWLMLAGGLRAMGLWRRQRVRPEDGV